MMKPPARLRLAVILLGIAMTGMRAEASQIPKLPTDQVTFAQIGRRPLDLSASGGTVGFVWGAPRPEPGTVASRYIPLDRDLDRTRSAAWYDMVAPDRLIRRCDSLQPANDYTYSWGAYAPLDISNRAVRADIFTRFVAPALAKGFPVIALDNVSLMNRDGRCGVRRDGKWVQLYSGVPKDPAYAQAVQNYVGWLAGQIHARDRLIALNVKVDPLPTAETEALIAKGDIWLEEGAFIDGCNGRVTGALWTRKFELSLWAAGRMGWIDLDKSCGPVSAMTTDNLEWSIANFLLLRGAESYYALVPADGGGQIRVPATLNPPVGAPLGPPVTEGNGWVRHYARGLIVVNPSETAEMALPLPNTGWFTLAGSRVAGHVLSLAPASAMVLLKGTQH